MLTLAGEYLAGRGVAVSAASVLEVLARAGVSEHAARSALTRMVGRGLLARQRHGRSMYFGLTERSERILRDGEQRLWRDGAVNRDWDGVWTLLGFSLPESWQRQRRELRAQLAWAGFAPLFNGLWIAAGRAETEEITTGLGLDARVKVFHATTLPGTDVDEMIRETWDLDAIAARHRTFLERWLPAEADAGADPLARKLQLDTDWLQVVRADPRLPLAHLPADWPAPEAEALFTRIGALAGPAAARLAEQLLDVRPLET
jgi:phenylacetic acid degradation operon negative regulatory protein